MYLLTQLRDDRRRWTINAPFVEFAVKWTHLMVRVMRLIHPDDKVKLHENFYDVKWILSKHKNKPSGSHIFGKLLKAYNFASKGFTRRQRKSYFMRLYNFSTMPLVIIFKISTKMSILFTNFTRTRPLFTLYGIPGDTFL